MYYLCFNYLYMYPFSAENQGGKYPFSAEIAGMKVPLFSVENSPKSQRSVDNLLQSVSLQGTTGEPRSLF